MVPDLGGYFGGGGSKTLAISVIEVLLVYNDSFVLDLQV